MFLLAAILCQSLTPVLQAQPLERLSQLANPEPLNASSIPRYGTFWQMLPGGQRLWPMSVR